MLPCQWNMYIHDTMAPTAITNSKQQGHIPAADLYTQTVNTWHASTLHTQSISLAEEKNPELHPPPPPQPVTSHRPAAPSQKDPTSPCVCRAALHQTI
jgi:hypothetical protein